MDRLYSERLQEFAEANPRDSEAWFALATSLGRCVGDVDFTDFRFDAVALRRAIEVDPRPVYLIAGYCVNEERAFLDTLAEVDPDNALVWLLTASDAIDRNDPAAAIRAARRSLECPRIDPRGAEAVQIHRRFARAFYGDGYTADSIILRHEYLSLGMYWDPYHLHWAAGLIKADAADTASAGDPIGAAQRLHDLYRLGCSVEDGGNPWGTGRLLRQNAAEGLLLLTAGSNPAEAPMWAEVIAGLPHKFGVCGNIYEVDDPWIVHNSWPGRWFHQRETFCGTWLPFWYFAHRGDFHLLAESVGSPALPAWRRADKWIRASPEPELDEGVEACRSLFFRPVRDRETFERLLAVAARSDEAVLTLIRSEWKPAPKPPPASDAATLYILAKLGSLDLSEPSTRSAVAASLADAFGLWAPDACKLAVALDRDAFLDAVDTHDLHPPWLFTYLPALREATGQDFGFDGEQWKKWLNARRAQAAQENP